MNTMQIIKKDIKQEELVKNDKSIQDELQKNN